ncbi:MAG: anhydro-N-acetylmuramic acid kinase [Pseudohongiellaceae bacterium]
MSAPRLFIGLISGTSIDGIDCALVKIADASVELLATHSEPITASLRQTLLQLCDNTDLSWELIGRADVEIARAFAAGVDALLTDTGRQAAEITAIGSHGQTVFHQPDSPYPFTMQLADPNTIAHRTGITTVADFSRKDMAAGGQGAPMAPLLHRFYFASPDKRRVVVNIGGIANISVIAPNQPFIAFDTGPGNVLMDYWVETHQNTPYDRDGRWAASGEVQSELLATLLDEDYFSLAYPKSTGRELFNHKWLKAKLAALDVILKPQDVQATLLELTAVSLQQAIVAQTDPEEVFVCGGGSHNKRLLGRLAELMPDATVDTTAAIGLDADWVEAVAFAWLASEALAGRAVDARSVTGAHKPCILGGIYPAN